MKGNTKVTYSRFLIHIDEAWNWYKNVGKCLTPYTICVCLNSLPTSCCCPKALSQWNKHITLFTFVYRLGQRHCAREQEWRSTVLTVWQSIAQNVVDGCTTPVTQSHAQNAVDDCMTPVTQSHAQNAVDDCMTPVTVPRTERSRWLHDSSHTVPRTERSRWLHDSSHTVPRTERSRWLHDPSHTVPRTGRSTWLHDPSHTVPRTERSRWLHDPSHAVPKLTVTAISATCTVNSFMTLTD